MKSITAFFISIMLFTVSNNEAKSQEKLLKAPHGITYSLLKTSSGKKIKLTNIVTLNLIEKTENDSVLFSSYELSSALKIRIHPSKELIDLMDVLVLLSEKDSVLIRVPADSIFKNNEDSRPAFLPKGSAVVFLVKIENVQTA